MRPVDFKGSNGKLSGFGEVSDLAVYRDGSSIVSCFELSDEDVVLLARTRRLWLVVEARITHPPVGFSFRCPIKGETDATQQTPQTPSR